MSEPSTTGFTNRHHQQAWSFSNHMKALFKFSLIPLLLHALTGHATLTVTNIASGNFAYHSLFLKSDGSLWVMGYNNSGQLGDGTLNKTNRPEQIMPGGVTAIAAGGYHSLFLKSDGSLWAMGQNNFGQLGDGTLTRTNRPEQIMPGGVTAIAAGGNSGVAESGGGQSLFLKSDGSLWGMGGNGSGQLGDGTFNSTNQPELIVTNGVTAIATGSAHSLFVKSDGSLWAMGGNGSGQLGDGTGISTNKPEQITNGVVAVAAGLSHSLFLKSDGSLWAMGDDSAGQLGDGGFGSAHRPELIVTNGVTAIAAGGQFSLFLKSDGSLWAMGDRTYGQLGDGSANNFTNRPEQIVASNVTAIAAGYIHSLFLKSDGSLWAMGYNIYGELGDGFTDTSYPADFGTDIPEQILPLPQPMLASAISSKTNIQIKATTGFGGKFSLLAGTNIAPPLSQWLPLRTNSITARGANNYSVTVTNAVHPGGGQFYILQSQ
jgi:alpha-tubulin suppressor-like RCC1 family protein